MRVRNAISCTVQSWRGGFFFQADVGIRDYDVTGVQTCALPIYSAVGGFEFTFIGDMYADSIAGQEGFPYLYGYLFGQSGQPNRINTYLTTGEITEAAWASGSATFPVPSETNKFRVFLRRSSYAGADDTNVAHFDDLCAFFNK